MAMNASLTKKRLYGDSVWPVCPPGRIQETKKCE